MTGGDHDHAELSRAPHDAAGDHRHPAQGLPWLEPGTDLSKAAYLTAPVSSAPAHSGAGDRPRCSRHRQIEINNALPDMALRPRRASFGRAC